MRARIAVVAALAGLAIPRPAQAVERYALSMFHFNVQYVAGGLVGYPAYAEELRPPEVEDLIVTQSLQPVLELYAAHPTWGANIEMQAYLLDVLAARHPDVLGLLRDLALAGQVEVVSFHYSDQLWVGYPREDWDHSQELVQATFAAHDIPLGTSVFCQEGQSGTAMADVMPDGGYTTMVWPKNLWVYQHGDFDAQPLYAFGDGNLVVAGKGVAYDDGNLQIETTWTFFDDGELLATNGWNPYFPDLYHVDPQAVADYEASLQDLETQGYVISTIHDYVESIRDRVPAAAVPPLLDGTWQPNSTNGVMKWLGGRSLWQPNGPPADRDNHVRTLGYLAHRELVAAKTAADVAGIDATSRLEAAWRLLALGEVTDASGINPYRGEVEYGLAHAAEALRIARDVVEEAKVAQGLSAAEIDPLAGTMVAGDAAPFSGTPSAPAVQLDVSADDPSRPIDVAWEQIAPGHHRVAIRFGPGDPASAAYPVQVTFHGEASDELVTTLALADDQPVTLHRSDFAFDTFELALPVGLVSLGPGLFLIKDTGHVHLAAEVHHDTGDVGLRDETLLLDESATWVFHVFEGSASEAVDLAHRINSARRLMR